MKTLLRSIRPLGVAVVLGFGGCTRMSQSLYLGGCDRDIKKAARHIETARDDAQRAEGYTQQGRAYSEKARYSRSFKLISTNEYERLFVQAIKGHDQAVALNPGSAEAYYRRGHTYYDRAVLETKSQAKPWFERASADFTKAIERDSRHFLAFDRRGLVHQQTGELDKAIIDFTLELAINSMGRARLADAYCERGSFYLKEKKNVFAIADFEKAVEIGAAADGCSCDPYNPLIGLYVGADPQHDKAWNIVHQAQKSNRWIGPELLEKLKKDSGRNS